MRRRALQVVLTMKRAVGTGSVEAVALAGNQPVPLARVLSIHFKAASCYGIADHIM